MLLGRCCHCGDTPRTRYVTLKCLDKTDGTIVWEQLVILPVQQYGADYIHAFQPIHPLTFNAYVYQCPTDGSILTTQNRASVTLSANAVKDAFEVVQFNSDDGTDANRNVATWLFAAQEQTVASGYAPFLGTTMAEADGLSGGEMIIAGHVPVQMELTDYASNNVTKTYVFHPHTHTAGSVTLKTRPSDQTISWAYNASSATVKTAIESVGDVSSATVTGGPWPFAALNVSVTWASSSGDFKSITFTKETLAGFSNRPTMSALFLVDPTSGAITKTFGYIFGNYSSAVKMHPSVSGFIPTVPDAIEPGGRPVAGASNSFCVQQGLNANNWIEGWDATSSTELWCVYNNHTVSTGEVRPNVVQKRSNAGMVYITGTKKTLAGSDWIGCKVDIAAGTRTEVNHSQSALNNETCVMTDADNDSATNAYHQFSTRFQQTSPGTVYVTVDEQGELDINGNIFRVGSHYLLGVDASSFYVRHSNDTPTFRYKNPAQTPALISSTNARGYVWRFYASPRFHLETGSEFRFKFTGNSSNPTKYSDWIDWTASAATIKTAIDAAFTANTGGVVDNVTMYPLGTPTAFDNTVGTLEQYLEIRFAGAANATGIAESYIPATYVQQNKITIETRNVSWEFSPPGIASFDRATAALNWTRAFGTDGGNTIAMPLDGWVRGDYFYAYGAIVENEIP